MILTDISDSRRVEKTANRGTAASDRDVTEGRVTLSAWPHCGVTLYPRCNEHGAMNALNSEIWRCGECGVGCLYIQ